MATPCKIPKIKEESTHSVWFRLCDPFIRTDGNLICPIIKAETSIRVLFRLQKKALLNILQKVSEETGMKTNKIKLSKSSSDRDLKGNLFIQCVSPNIINEETQNHFKERLIFHLSRNTAVKYILIDQVDSTEEIIPQPMISEPDFEMQKLELVYKTLFQIQPDSDETDAVSPIRDSIKEMLDEFKEKRTKIALLSHNGKGKSYLLNLLFLLTIDNEEEYRNNNKILTLPKDIIGDPTIEELGETINKLPDVVKDFLKTYTNTQQKFKSLMEPMCFELKPDNIEDSKSLFSSLPNYFKEGGKIKSEPYILAQRTRKRSYESTTKCIIRLRYGTVYQIKVEYFSSEHLKQQLFELVSLSRNDKTNAENGVNKCIKDIAYKCLQTRFAILTDSDVNQTVLQNYNTYNDIVLREEVEQFAGRTELHIGSGRNSTEDRLALKAILKGLSPHKSDSENGKWKYRVAAVKEIVVYLPSKFLYGGKEILEIPGTDDSDPVALHLIDKGLSMVDAVIVMSEYAFNCEEKQVTDILIGSDFMQNWKKSPDDSSLMLLTYPEKDENFQFESRNIREIEDLENLEVDKRDKELTQLCTLLKMQSLPQNIDAAIFTSYILPVLHTSIHAQEGIPHQIIHEHACFLKFTGIEKLITHLDTFISSSRKKHFQQMQLQKILKMTKGLSAKNATVLTKMYQRQDIKSTRVDELYHHYDNLMKDLSKNLETVFTSKLDAQVADAFAEMKTKALQTWDSNKKNITSTGVFNPRFSGNHPTYKVKISKIIIENTEDLTSQIFAFLKKKISQLLNKFKMDTIDLFTQELNSLLLICGHESIDLRNFVEQSIQDVLSAAQQWYFGRVKKQINERTVEKYLKDSKKFMLRKHILTPAYEEKNLNRAKELARKNIACTVMAVKDELKSCLLDLHYTRWTSFRSHLKARNSIPKPWQVLLYKIKQSCQSTQQQQPDELSAVLKLIEDINRM